MVVQVPHSHEIRTIIHYRTLNYTLTLGHVLHQSAHHTSHGNNRLSNESTWKVYTTIL